MTNSGKVLEIEGLTVTFGRGEQANVAVQELSLVIRPGETLGLVGESGSGKSVTALSIMGLLPDVDVQASGAVYLEGQDLLQMSGKERQRLNGNRLGMIYQEPMRALNPLLRIGFQLEEPLRYHVGRTRREARHESAALLREVGLPGDAAMLRRYPFQLSGGQRQRVMIAMAMSLRPPLLIADEPTTALDVTVQAQILTLMRHLRAEHGMAMLLITHDLGVVASMAHRVAVMYAGHILETAPVEQLFFSPAHPYTRGLLRAIPRTDQRAHRLYTIQGQVPRIRTPGATGCVFRARCEESTEKCALNPPVRYLSPEHWARCWYVEGKNATKH